MAHFWKLDPENHAKVDVLGWYDLEHHKHKGQPDRNDPNVDGLIIHVYPPEDRDAGRTVAVFATSWPMKKDAWQRVIHVLMANAYDIELDYDYDADEDEDAE